MKCAYPKHRPGRCDLCGGKVKPGEENPIEDMLTRQRGHCCDSCLATKVWRLGPCCRKVG